VGVFSPFRSASATAARVTVECDSALESPSARSGAQQVARDDLADRRHFIRAPLGVFSPKPRQNRRRIQAGCPQLEDPSVTRDELIIASPGTAVRASQRAELAFPPRAGPVLLLTCPATVYAWRPSERVAPPRAVASTRRATRIQPATLFATWSSTPELDLRFPERLGIAGMGAVLSSTLGKLGELNAPEVPTLPTRDLPAPAARSYETSPRAEPPLSGLRLLGQERRSTFGAFADLLDPPLLAFAGARGRTVLVPPPATAHGECTRNPEGSLTGQTRPPNAILLGGRGTRTRTESTLSPSSASRIDQERGPTTLAGTRVLIAIGPLVALPRAVDRAPALHWRATVRTDSPLLLLHVHGNSIPCCVTLS
jgi:hypothetical protein